MNPTTVGTIQYNAVIDTTKLKASANEANDIVQESGDKASSGFGKAMGIASAAGVAAFGAMAGAAVKSFADFEQLQGGVVKLFGSASDSVIQNAEVAYKTAGMSANAYLDTVTSFSASLIKSTGGDTVKAAQIADKAVRDMSDNANTFGTDIASLQYAYQGFAKGNFTMLDNLKLGYGGSQEGMQALLTDAEKLPAALGRKFDMSNFADVADAIHLIQEEQKIAGTTAKEASSTIAGSWSALTGSFSNVLAGVEGSGQQLSDSVLNMFNQLVEKVPGIVGKMVAGISDAMKTVIDEKLGSGAFDILSTIAVAFTVLAGAITIYNTVTKIAAATQALFNAVMAANPIGLIILALAVVTTALVYFFTQTDTGKRIMEAVSTWITTTFIPTIKSIGEWFVNAWNKIVEIWSGAVSWFQGVWNGIVAIFSAVVGFYIGVYSAAWNGIVAVFGVAVGWFAGVWNGIVGIFNGVAGFFGNVFRGAYNAVTGVFSGLYGFFSGVWNTIVGLFSGVGTTVGNAIGGTFKGVINSVVGGAVRIINGFIGTINGAVGAINKLPGVNIGKIGTLGVPQLANGGIIMNQPGGMLANIGEGREPEAVIPLSKLDTMLNGDRRGGGDIYNITMNGVNDPADFTRQLKLSTQGRL